MTLLRSTSIYAITFLWALLYWSAALLPVLFAALSPAERRRHRMRVILLGFGLTTVRLAWRPFFKVHYEDRTGGVRKPGIVVANHRSAIDGFLVSLPKLSMAQTVNGWPLRLPVIGHVARFAGYLNITEWDYETLKTRAAAVLENGDPIVSYPEGTRSESRTMNPFRSGIFRVAMELKVPIYMLCIAGNEHMPDRKFRFREFRDLSVRLSGPLADEEISSCATAYALKQKVFRLMSGELAEMDAELDHEKSI